MSNLVAVHQQLLTIAANHAAGDFDATSEALTILINLHDTCESADEDASERLLNFLLEASSPPLEGAELIRTLLGDLVLEVLPRLLCLAAASPRAAATAAALTESLAGVGSPRELLTALLEVYDMNRETAFDSPMHLLLLRCLGLMPRLVAAVQRRRLQVALSCLPAVADLASAAAPQLAGVRRAVEAMAAVAAAAAAAEGDGGAAAAPSGRLEGEAAIELWHEAEEQLVEPFVGFVRQLQEMVLATELPPLDLTCASKASPSIPTAAAPTAAAPEASAPVAAGAAGRTERLRLAAWLLALFGALQPAWGPPLPLPAGGKSTLAARRGDDASGGGGSGWCGSRPAAVLLDLLLTVYLPALREGASSSLPLPPPPPSSSSPPPPSGSATKASLDLRWRGPGSAPAAVSWLEVWEAAGAAGCEPSGPDAEVCSDPELPRLGAATLLWLATTNTRNKAPLAAAVMAAAGAEAEYPVDGAAGRGVTHGSVPCPAAPEPPAGDAMAALVVVLEACQALLQRAGEEESTELRNRALQLLASGCTSVRLMGGQTPPGAVAPGNGRVVAAAPASDDPWVAVAEQLSHRPCATATALYDMLGVYEPKLEGREAAIEPLAQKAAVVAALNVTHGSVGPAGDAARMLAHGALQALFGALPPSLRALCMERLAAGPSPEVSALVLQRLQREVSAAAAAAVARPHGCSSIFDGPWVLRPLLQQLLQLLPAEAASTAVAVPYSETTGCGYAGAGDGETRLQRVDEAAAEALTHRADAATAAVSVLRFLALRTRGDAASGSIGVHSVASSKSARDEVGAHGASAAAESRTARRAVLTVVYDTAVRPLCCTIAAALEALQRRVALESVAEVGGAACAGGGGRSPETAPHGSGSGPAWIAAAAEVASQRHLSAAVTSGAAAAGAAAARSDRFASNVALVSEAVAGLTAVSRLQEVALCVEELLLLQQQH